jgi:hypothetical protein
MPMNGFNVGRDVTLNIVGFDGSVKSFSLITNFDRRQDTNHIQVKGLDGVVRHLEIPDGWQGTFDVEKQDDAIDAYFATLEQAYYDGQNIAAATITETITNVNGSISQYSYTGVMLKYDDAGGVKGDDTIKPKISWCASRRLKKQ